jgi:hypothetical protein
MTDIRTKISQAEYKIPTLVPQPFRRIIMNLLVAFNEAHFGCSSCATPNFKKMNAAMENVIEDLNGLSAAGKE